MRTCSPCGRQRETNRWRAFCSFCHPAQYGVSAWRWSCIKIDLIDILWFPTCDFSFYIAMSAPLRFEAFSDRWGKTSHWAWIYNHRCENVLFFWKQPVSSHNENAVVICTYTYIKNWIVYRVIKLGIRNILQSVAHIWTCWTPIRALSKLTLQWCKL